MAGYSGKPLLEKLGLKAGMRAHITGARVYHPPAGVRAVRRLAPDMEFIHFFTSRRSELDRKFAAFSKALAPAGMLWISWPKGSSGVATDLTEHVVREIGLSGELVDVKVCAVDDTWSGLKFVRRLKDRKG